MSNRNNDRIYPINRQPNNQQPEKQPPRYPQQPEKQQDNSPSGVLLFIELMLFIASMVAAVLFISFLPLDYYFEYTETILPVQSTQLIAASPIDRIDESEIPIPPEPELEYPVYDFALPVPESTYHSLDYFNDVVFIGDSRTVGLITYTKIAPIDYSSVGLNISSISTKDYLRYTNESGQSATRTVYEALEAEAGNYKSIYIATGVNELGWSTNGFIKTYRQVIEDIRAITDVPIYIQLIIPVTTKAQETSTTGISNDKAREFNARLRALAAELEVYMIDPIELFTLEDGSLDPEFASDGVHLSISAYKTLLEYYQTHVVDPEAWENLRTVEEEPPETTEQ
ncbi:MAG: hypothetical protein IJ493_10900 [Clostridia bacterium]|nr:hypothetical protein [Clostridia bacterium]